LLSGGEASGCDWAGRVSGRGPLGGFRRALLRAGAFAREALLKAARVRWATATFLCITHDISQTLDFPRVLVVDKGRVAEDGAPRDLADHADTRYASLLAAEVRARAVSTVLSGGICDWKRDRSRSRPSGETI